MIKVGGRHAAQAEKNGYITINMDIYCHLLNAARILGSGFAQQVALNDGLMKTRRTAIGARLGSGAPGFDAAEARLDGPFRRSAERAPASSAGIAATPGKQATR